jgi:hypothetical protein
VAEHRDFLAGRCVTVLPVTPLHAKIAEQEKIVENGQEQTGSSVTTGHRARKESDPALFRFKKHSTRRFQRRLR